MPEEHIEAWAEALPDGMVAVHFKWTADDEVEFKLLSAAAEELKDQLGRHVETARRTLAATAALHLP